jgi:hypothetical protein
MVITKAKLGEGAVLMRLKLLQLVTYLRPKRTPWLKINQVRRILWERAIAWTNELTYMTANILYRYWTTSNILYRYWSKLPCPKASRHEGGEWSVHAPVTLSRERGWTDRGAAVGVIAMRNSPAPWREFNPGLPASHFTGQSFYLLRSSWNSSLHLFDSSSNFLIYSNTQAPQTQISGQMNWILTPKYAAYPQIPF